MINRKNLINFSSILFCLLPFSLLTGPLAPEIIIFFVNLIFLYFTIKEKTWFYFLNYFVFGFFLFYFYILIRSLTSEYPYLSLESSLFYFRFGILSLATWFLIKNKENFIKIFFYFLIISVFIALIDGYYQFFNDKNIFGFDSPKVRMSLTFNDDLLLGNFLSRILPLLFAVLIYSFSRTKYIYSLFFIIFISTDVLIYITGERTAFILLTLSAIFIVCLMKNFKILRLFSIVVSSIIIIIITLNSPELKDRNITSTFNQITSKVESTTSEDNQQTNVIFSIHHHRLIMTSYNMFLDNPLFGQGPKLFRKYCSKSDFMYDENSCSTHPHNSYAQMLAEIGLFGTLFYLIIIIYFIFLISRHLYQKYFMKVDFISDYNVALISCFFISLWPFAPTLNLFNNWINILYFLPVGFYLHSINNKN